MSGYKVIDIKPDPANPNLDLVWFALEETECHGLKGGHGLQVGDLVVGEQVLSKMDGSVLTSSGSYFGKALNSLPSPPQGSPLLEIAEYAFEQHRLQKDKEWNDKIRS